MGQRLPAINLNREEALQEARTAAQVAVRECLNQVRIEQTMFPDRDHFDANQCFVIVNFILKGDQNPEEIYRYQLQTVSDDGEPVDFEADAIEALTTGFLDNGWGNRTECAGGVTHMGINVVCASSTQSGKEAIAFADSVAGMTAIKMTLAAKKHLG